MIKPVVILGAGGHGRVIADCLKSARREVLGFLDDQKSPGGAVHVLGRLSDAPSFANQAEFIIGIGDNKARKAIAQRFAGVLAFTTAVHKSAVLAPDVVLGEGCVVMPGAVINVGSVLGQHNIINTSASIDHDGRLADFVHLSPGARLAGQVTLGEGVWLGTGAIAINNISVHPWCVIGAGGLVIRDLMEPGTYVGVPVAKKAASL